MRYMFLISSDESTWDFSDEAMGGWGEFTESVGSRMSSGEALRRAATATTVKVRSGDIVSTDGPFIETKEVLPGAEARGDYLDNTNGIVDTCPPASSLAK